MAVGSSSKKAFISSQKAFDFKEVNTSLLKPDDG
jgi:hypothetical protein